MSLTTYGSNLVRFSGDTQGVESLFADAFKQAIVGVMVCKRIIKDRFPQIASATGFVNSYNILGAAESPTLHEMYRRPEYFLLSDRLQGYVLQEVGDVNLVSLTDDLFEFARFAIAALLQDGVDGEIGFKLDEHGVLSIPGYDFNLSFGTSSAYSTGLFILKKNTINVLLGEDSFLIPVEVRLWSPEELQSSAYSEMVVPVMRVGELEIKNSDPLLRRAGSTLYDFETLTSQNAIEWGAVSESALISLATFFPEALEEIRSQIKIMVPVRSVSKSVSVSASFPNCLGAIFMSRGSSHLTFAETLVHEYSHNKLNAVFKKIDLFSNEDLGLEAYSPWKNELRPVRGLFHGIYAFQGVCQLFEKCLSKKEYLTQASIMALEARFYLIDAQIRLALDSLDSIAAYTPDGKKLRESVQDVIENNVGLLVKISPSARRSIDKTLLAHRMSVLND